MYFDLPKFRHVHYIVNKPAPKFDLAWSNLLPRWPEVMGPASDQSMISAGDPLGDKGFIGHIASMYGIDKNRIIITNGCSEANFLAYLSSLKKGDRVLIEKPIYTPLLEIPKALGCEVHSIKRRPDRYRFDLKELREKIETISPDLFVVQNLNNPTGKALFEPELKDLVKILSDYDLLVLVDEVYRDFAMSHHDGRLVNAFPSMVELYDKAIITSSVTKVYGAGGLMAGWMIGPKRIINRARRSKIYSVPMVNHMGNRIALEILRKRDIILPAEFKSLREKLNIVSSWAKGRKDVHWSEPDGCAVGFLRYDHDINSLEVCERLYDDHEVRVVPGEFFHLERGFRVSVAVDTATLKGGLMEIDRFFDQV
jgi:aspartate/methionine/tyrosine aminotransferase